MTNFNAEYRIFHGVYEGFGPGGLNDEITNLAKKIEAKDDAEAVGLAVKHAWELSGKYLADSSGYCTVTLNELKTQDGREIDVKREIMERNPHIDGDTAKCMFPNGKYVHKVSWILGYEKLKNKEKESKTNI